MIYAYGGEKIMSQKLNLALKTSLNLTMSLRQSINILQMPHVELSTMINQELEKNPFLQSEDDQPSDFEEKRDFDYLQISSDSDNYNPLGNVTDTKSSFEYVLEQIGGLVSNETDRIIAFYLANLLNENGLIELNMDSAIEDLKCPREKILSILEKLQEMEPAGIFARNLSECLKLQLIDRNLFDITYDKILRNLDMIAGHNLGKLAKICNIRNEDLIDRIKQIQKLNPRPISLRDIGCASTRIADVILTISDSQNIEVRLNKEASPKISVNQTYYNNIKKKKLGEKDKDFVTNEYYSANNLVRAVSQRSKTILEVARAIAEKQRNFFLKGVMYFEPMTLADIAKICDMNESTISRTTNGKFIETPTGIYEMKFFFSSNVSAKNSDNNVSSTKVKEIIKTIIEEETPDDILSDDAIAEQLSKFNINIARRTVAKYREALGIETSSLRKRKARSLVLA